MAPVRLSMGGGGTDLPSYYTKYGGFLMAAAIDKYIYIAANKRYEKTIRLSYSKTEIVNNVNDIEHRIFKAAMRHTDVNNQIEIVSVSDVPSQCGLGTSSAFTVSLLNALFTYQKRYVSLNELAETACHIELELLKEPIGKQDQYASSFGGFNAYWFNHNGNVTVEPVSIKEGSLRQLQDNIMLFYLKNERSARDIISVQDKKTKEDDSETINRLHKIKEIGLRTKTIFESGDINEFGEILHEHWLTKKMLSDNISSPYIDEIYDLARKNGATGGKIVGAGGGGFLLVYCPKGKNKLLSAMDGAGLSPMWFSFEQGGAKIVFHN